MSGRAKLIGARTVNIFKHDVKPAVFAQRNYGLKILSECVRLAKKRVVVGGSVILNIVKRMRKRMRDEQHSRSTALLNSNTAIFFTRRMACVRSVCRWINTADWRLTIVINRTGFADYCADRAMLRWGSSATTLSFLGAPWRILNIHQHDPVWAIIGEICESVGLRWGGRWRDPHDPGHLELSTPVLPQGRRA